MPNEPRSPLNDGASPRAATLSGRMSVRACPLAYACILLGLTLPGIDAANGAAPIPDMFEGAALGKEFDAPTRRWREGPARYLLTREENRTYRNLKQATPEERAIFIEEFWARRDPSPAQPGNLYRELFYERVAEANRLFNDAPVPGWKTDRGKVHILLGPPDAQERITRGRSDRFAILWTYRSMKTLEGLGLSPTIRFIQDRNGEYRMSTNIRLLFQETSMGLTFQAQALQVRALPPARAAPLADGAYLEDDPILASANSAITTRRDFFRSVQGGTLVVLTVGVRPQKLAGDTGHRSGSRFEVEAHLLDPGAPDGGYEVEGKDGRLAEVPDENGAGSDYTIFQGGVVVPPGRYIVRYKILDRQGTIERTLQETAEVPGFPSRTLMISSVALARSVERLSPPAREYGAPFILRDRRVVRHPDHLFRRGDDLSFFYETYGLVLDPIDGRPEFDVEYRFFIAGTGVNEDESGFSPLGHPIHLTRRKSPVQDFSISLKGWSRGLYRLLVTVDDALTDQTFSREVTFRIN